MAAEQTRGVGCATLLVLCALAAATSSIAFAFAVYILRRLELAAHTLAFAASAPAALALLALTLAWSIAPRSTAASTRIALGLFLAAALDAGAVVAAPRLDTRIPPIGEAARALLDAPDLRTWGTHPLALPKPPPGKPPLVDAGPAGGPVDDAAPAVDAGPVVDDPPGTIYGWTDADGDHVSNDPPPAGTPGVRKKYPRATADNATDALAHGSAAHDGAAHDGAAHDTDALAHGAAHDGAHDGAAHDGAAHAHDGAAHDGGAGAHAGGAAAGAQGAAMEPAWSPLDDFVKKGAAGGMAPALSGISGDGDLASLTDHLSDVVEVRFVSAACTSCGGGDFDARGQMGSAGHYTVYVVVDADPKRQASGIAADFARANHVANARVIVITPGRASFAGRSFTLDPRGNFVRR